MTACVLFLAALALGGCTADVWTELARPAPDLPTAVQVSRVLVIGAGIAGFVAIGVAIIRRQS